MPDDEPIPDYPNQVMEEETVRNNLLMIGDDKNWALKQKKLPWLWKGQDKSDEEKEVSQKNEEEKMSCPAFPLKQEPVYASETSDDDDETESSSDEESYDSGFEDDGENMEKGAPKSLGPLLGLVLGSTLLGGSLGYCHARYVPLG